MNKAESPMIDEFNPLYLSKIKASWHWLLALGLSLIILGSIAILKALTATIVSLYVLGFIILFSGIGYIVYSFKFWWTNWARLTLYLILGSIYCIAGFLIIEDPLGSSFPITLFLAMFYMFVGLWRIISSFRFKLPRATWEMLGGVISFILGILIWIQWPSTSLWVIGLFVGIDILLIGLYFTAISIFARKLTPT